MNFQLSNICLEIRSEPLSRRITSTLPVSIIANCPATIPVGVVSAVNRATLAYTFAIANPRPVEPVGPVTP